MTNKLRSNSNFVSFLENYKEQNIASIKNSLGQNLDEIDYNLKILIELVSRKKFENSIILDLHESKKILKSDRDILERAFAFGISIANNESLLKYSKSDVEVQKSLKMIIFYYAKFAKQSEEDRIIKVLKFITNKIK